MWQPDIFQSGSRVDDVEPIAQASLQFRRDPTLAISFEEFAQALVLERANHVRDGELETSAIASL